MLPDPCRRVALAHGAWGLALLRSRQPVVRVLGARHVAEAVIVGVHPARGRVRACAAIDAVHAASMLAVAALRPDWRDEALVSAAASLALGAATWRAARDA